MEEYIKILEALMSEYVGKSKEYELHSVPIHIDENDIQAIEKLINKNKELEKMVELMAKYIQALISKYEDDTYTYTSIIDYFKKKASVENEQSR